MSTTPASACAVLLSFAALLSGPSAAADDAALMKDLSAVIALGGTPCGTVVEVERQAKNDHIATCSNGMRYRVFLNPQGRVVTERH